MKRAFVMAAMVSVAALGACSKKPEAASAGGAATTTSATTAVAAAPALPASPPSRKPGLWEQTISSDRIHQSSQLCVDEALDSKMKWWGPQQAKQTCQEQSVTPKLGGGWSFHSVCNMGQAGTITSTGEATGDWGGHYTVAIDSTTTGSSMPQANGEHKTQIDATWKGPCPAGMRGGDMTLPGGMKINMLDVMNGAGPAMPSMNGHKMSAADMQKLHAQAEQMAAAMKKQ